LRYIERGIEVADDVLTISGEHEESSEQEGAHRMRRERRYGSFSRPRA
jgi:HSP20 family molecular chaperone IbpA